MVHGKDDGVRTRLRMGMVGGGPGAFIGAVHRIALTHRRRVSNWSAGAFSSDPQKQQARAATNSDSIRQRVYGSVCQEMAEREKAALPEDQRIHAVSHRHARITSTTARPRCSSSRAFTSSVTSH